MVVFFIVVSFDFYVLFFYRTFETRKEKRWYLADDTAIIGEDLAILLFILCYLTCD